MSSYNARIMMMESFYVEFYKCPDTTINYKTVCMCSKERVVVFLKFGRVNACALCVNLQTIEHLSVNKKMPPLLK